MNKMIRLVTGMMYFFIEVHIRCYIVLLVYSAEEKRHTERKIGLKMEVNEKDLFTQMFV